LCHAPVVKLAGLKRRETRKEAAGTVCSLPLISYLLRSSIVTDGGEGADGVTSLFLPLFCCYLNKLSTNLFYSDVYAILKARSSIGWARSRRMARDRRTKKTGTVPR
jgi:hypothetical protein